MTWGVTTNSRLDDQSTSGLAGDTFALSDGPFQVGGAGNLATAAAQASSLDRGLGLGGGQGFSTTTLLLVAAAIGATWIVLRRR